MAAAARLHAHMCPLRLLALLGVLALALLPHGAYGGRELQPAAAETAAPRTVLVLGSGGVVGSALAAELRRRGNKVLEVRNRLDVDLRKNNSLKVFDNEQIDFCFFVACEVGGSKFLAGGGYVQEAVWQYNVFMYDNVLPYLHRRGVKHIFTSSQLKSQPTAYGMVKTLGEDLVAKSPLGKSVRFWNVYGPERIGIKSHVLNDWLYQCVKYGRVEAMTDGNEQRQFSHADDVAVTLSDAMLTFDSLPQVSAVTNGHWQTMRDVAAVISSLVRCEFTFSSKQSSTMKGMDPTQINLLRVNSDLTLRMRAMIQHSHNLVVEETTWRSRSPYLSIVFTSSNDEYEGGAKGHGIRWRTFNFLKSVVATAEAAHLDYELILVQYNPNMTTDYTDRAQYSKTDFDLPWSQLFPWTSRHSFGRLRIITIPHSLHKWPEKGKFWEYTAKNAGVRRARGEYVLLTNPDDIYPPGLFAQIAKQGLLPNHLYRSGMFVDFEFPPDKDPVEVCNSIASVARSCYLDKTWCPKGMTQREDARNTFIGDFELWHREAFLTTNGYMEMAQNTWVEAGHFMFGSANLTLKNTWFDEFTCHQIHERKMHQSGDIPHEWEIYLMHVARDPKEPTGLLGVELQEAHMYDILQAAYNPETPYMSYTHDTLFRFFGSSLQAAPFEPRVVQDFLGVRTAYEHICVDDERSGRFGRLGQRLPCDRQDEFVRQGYSGPLLGDMPVVDEDYFEWQQLLRAVTAASHAPLEETYVAVELGSGYGAWAARNGVAMRRLQPDRRVRLLAVEADLSKTGWLEAHLASNNLTDVAVTATGFQDSDPDSSATRVTDSAQMVSLMSSFAMINIIHCDIKGHEAAFLEAPLQFFASARVRAIHLRTYSKAGHEALRAAFSRQGWRVLQDMAGGLPEPTQTPFGPVRVPSQGILSLENVGRRL